MVQKLVVYFADDDQTIQLIRVDSKLRFIHEPEYLGYVDVLFNAFLFNSLSNRQKVGVRKLQLLRTRNKQPYVFLHYFCINQSF
ncbi:hypothetical protein D3C78_1591470 [compost metagenome]